MPRFESGRPHLVAPHISFDPRVAASDANVTRTASAESPGNTGLGRSGRAVTRGAGHLLQKGSTGGLTLFRKPVPVISCR